MCCHVLTINIGLLNALLLYSSDSEEKILIHFHQSNVYGFYPLLVDSTACTMSFAVLSCLYPTQQKLGYFVC